MTELDKKAIRRMATAEAASMLGGILAKSGGVVTSAVWSAGKKAGVGVAKAVGTGAVQASKEVLDVTKKMGSTAVETTGQIAGQTWDITKSAAEKINPFKKKVDGRDDTISENIDDVTPGTNAGDL